MATPPVPVIELDDEPKGVPPSKSPGVMLGSGGAAAVTTLLLSRLMSDTFTWATQWNQVTGLFVAALLLLAWAFVEARSERVHTGVPFMDRPREVPSLNLNEKPKA